MRHNSIRLIVLFSLMLILVACSDKAEAARRSSLAGKQLITDTDDMFAFPQLLAKYSDRIIFDFAPGGSFGSNTQTGDASVVFGDEKVFNINTGRGDFLNNTASWAWGGADRFFGVAGVNGIPGNNGSSGAALEWWDVGYAATMGGTPVGFNISWAKNSRKITPSVGDPTVDNSSSMISLQAGATINNIDFAGEVGFGGYTDDLEGLDPSDQNDYSFFNFALLARGNVDDFAGQNWRWIASFATGSN